MTMSGIIPVCVLSHFSHAQLFVTLWSQRVCGSKKGQRVKEVCSPQTSLPTGFFRQEYWSGLPCPPPGDLPDPGIECGSLTSPCIGRQVLYHWCYLGSPVLYLSPCIICGGGSKQRGEGGYNGSSSPPSFLFAHFCSPLTFKEHNKEYDH